jgi:hypothetical protein
MLLVDTKEKTMIQDVELKRNIAASRPHSLWLKEQVLSNAILYFRIINRNYMYLFELHNEKLRDLYSSPSIIRMIKSRRMRWVEHVT